MAMVVQANKKSEGIGGHISTYASAATLFEIGFNHFFRGENEDHEADIVYFQGHASPGVYARSFLEGRLTEQDLHNFRQELAGGRLAILSPSAADARVLAVSNGFDGTCPINGHLPGPVQQVPRRPRTKERTDQKIWALVGDGEMDEPEALGAITVASREQLDNLIFVVNCNLQRLDGPVRGNGKVIQELEAAFRGAGWNVIKVIWGRDWDPLLARDDTGDLVRVMNETCDGQFQKYVVSSGEYIRKDFFGRSEKLKKMVGIIPMNSSRNCAGGGTTRSRFIMPSEPLSRIRVLQRSSWPRRSRDMVWEKPVRAGISPISKRNSMSRNFCSSGAVSAFPFPMMMP